MEEIDVFKGILNNYVFVAVLSCTIIFQIIIIEFLGTFANTTPLTFAQWFLSVFIGFLGMPIAAGLKMIPVWATWVRDSILTKFVTAFPSRFVKHSHQVHQMQNIRHLTHQTLKNHLHKLRPHCSQMVKLILFFYSCGAHFLFFLLEHSHQVYQMPNIWHLTH